MDKQTLLASEFKHDLMARFNIKPKNITIHSSIRVSMKRQEISDIDAIQIYSYGWIVCEVEFTLGLGVNITFLRVRDVGGETT